MADQDEELPERLDVERARMAVARREVTVIDVRSEEEFAGERIFGSVHVEADGIGEALGEGDRDASLLIVCADGERSAEAAERLRGDGHRAASLDGGFDAWTSEGLPTAPGRDEEYEGPDVKIPGAVSSSGEPEDEDGEAEEEEEEEEEGSPDRQDG